MAERPRGACLSDAKWRQCACRSLVGIDHTWRCESTSPKLFEKCNHQNPFAPRYRSGALDAPWKIRPLALRSAASLVSPHGSHAHRVRCARAMRARCRAASDRECASRAPCRQGRTGSAGRAADSSSTMPGASSDAMCSVTFRRDAPQPHEVRALASHPCQALLLHLFPRSCVGDSSVRCCRRRLAHKSSPSPNASPTHDPHAHTHRDGYASPTSQPVTIQRHDGPASHAAQA